LFLSQACLCCDWEVEAKTWNRSPISQLLYFVTNPQWTMLRQSEKEENKRNKREVGFGRTNGDGGDAPSGGVMRRPLNLLETGSAGAGSLVSTPRLLADLVSLESFYFEGGERPNERVRKRCEHEDRGYPKARGSFPGEKESPITASVENPTLFL